MTELAALRAAIAAHEAMDSHEAEMQQQVLAFVDNHVDCLWRTQLRGHITASAWVLDRTGTQVLLIHHRKLNRWLQPGGHADGDADTLAVAQREVWEETGLETEPVFPGIFDIDVHAIPARGAEPEHFHHDIRHLLRAREGASLALNHEVRAAEWVPLAAVAERVQDRSILRMVEKTLAPHAGQA